MTLGEIEKLLNEKEKTSVWRFIRSLIGKARRRSAGRYYRVAGDKTAS